MYCQEKEDECVGVIMPVQKKVKCHYRKVRGKKKKVKVRGHLRIKRTDIKKKGKGR
jgi:hypothetical protein